MVLEIKPAERQERIKRIQDEMKKRDIDAYLIHSTQSDFASVLYLSNHSPVWS
jgi:Xaa-Pro aminopeptidase